MRIALNGRVGGDLEKQERMESEPVNEQAASRSSEWFCHFIKGVSMKYGSQVCIGGSLWRSVWGISGWRNGFVSDKIKEENRGNAVLIHLVARLEGSFAEPCHRGWEAAMHVTRHEGHSPITTRMGHIIKSVSGVAVLLLAAWDN